MTHEEFKNELIALRACGEATRWVTENGYARTTAWALCGRPDWMLWYLRTTKQLPKRLAVQLACAFARRTLHLIPAGEDRPRLAIEAAEAWLINPCEETRGAAAAGAAAASERKAQCDIIRACVKL